MTRSVPSSARYGASVSETGAEIPTTVPPTVTTPTTWFSDESHEARRDARRDDERGVRGAGGVEDAERVAQRRSIRELHGEVEPVVGIERDEERSREEAGNVPENDPAIR